VDLRVGVEGKRAVRRVSTRGKGGARELVMGCASKRKEMVVGKGSGRARERREGTQTRGRTGTLTEGTRASRERSGRERRQAGASGASLGSWRGGAAEAHT
jgi:hypothetical protein